MAEYQTVSHTFGPVYDDRSGILILGSFPSVKSREQQFYYGHPQNRFWKVLAGLFGVTVPETIDQKRVFLLQSRIAVWDVIAQCEIVGSSDSSIRQVVPNDMNRILKEAPVREVYTNGTKAWELYQKYCYPQCGRESIRLPSTSPANAAYRLERLEQEWSRILLPLKQEL